ncbi:Folliculin [Cyphellophora attinorum]|uniref:Folliculin n=1 Tax=Cyphellophora attinorum TaxID=1664694 RepID=A0A0N1P3U7_9EURO|nr:Folliculin [Phialophora attinorum]KPI44552.1 Folliculin [Phialophora attinorum]
MDFTISLTHFCETHGPKNVLCTQVLPVECATCLPPTPPLRARSSGETLDGEDDYHEYTTTQQHAIPSLRKTGTDLTLPTDFFGASTTIDSEPESPNIERHPLFRHSDTDIAPRFRYGRAQGETCASCSFTVPDPVAGQLPAGAPGSIKADRKSKNGAPVFRSRELVCLGSSPPDKTNNLDMLGAHSNGSAANSYPGSSSYNSSSQSHSHSHHHSSDTCHEHTFTYLTAKSPSSPETYAALRASVIRTLSCEMLPRGMADGPLCFGDSIAGYTIAYIFRLTDPKARGRRRCYAFLALAGTDASRAFRACPMLWQAFAGIAKGIEAMATRAVEEKERKEEEERSSTRPVSGAFGTKSGTGGSSGGTKEKLAYTPVSSFLTQRAMDPDGTMRRAGQTSPRSLADIVGDETIFAALHRYFVVLLRMLGASFGGVPIASESVYQTTVAGAGDLDEIHSEKVNPIQLTKPRTRNEDKAAEAKTDKTKSSATGSPQKGSSKQDAPPPTIPANGTTLPTRTRTKGDIDSGQGRKERTHKPREPSTASTSTTSTTIEDDIMRAKRRLSKTLSLSATGPCAPLQVTQADVMGKVAVAGGAVVK